MIVCEVPGDYPKMMNYQKDPEIEGELFQAVLLLVVPLNPNSRASPRLFGSDI